MGVLVYDGNRFPFDDRLLAHLQVVIGLKLRRGESFFISWKVSAEHGSGRRSLWIDNGIPIHCEYDGSKAPSINRDWLDTFATSANGASGLQITEENTLEATQFALAAD